jgi:hypothetical protein
MRLLLAILFLCSLSAENCKNLKSDLNDLAREYSEAMKVLSTNLMTTPGVIIKVKPDLNKVQKIVDATNTLVKKCNKSDDISQNVKDIYHGLKAIDKDLQVMGTFDNANINKLRINAIVESTKFIAMLLKFNSKVDDTQKKPNKKAANPHNKKNTKSNKKKKDTDNSEEDTDAEEEPKSEDDETSDDSETSPNDDEDSTPEDDDSEDSNDDEDDSEED